MSKTLPEIQSFARIKVIGVGGSGKGAINHMISSNLKGIDFIAMNTDTQDLHNCLASKKIHLGKNLTKGLGAGMDPEVGRKSAEETKEEIQDAVKGADIVFIACGMGGGTATGAAPVIAKAAKEEGILTVAIVTKPFFFEGQKRATIAEGGLVELEKEVDALIAIPNDRLLSVIDRNMSVKDAFKMVDEVLKQAVDGIADIIKTAGTINLDFADIKRVLKDSGTALIGIGTASGENRAIEAAKAAISSPLLDVSINGAKGLLYAIYGNENLSMFEVSEAAKVITESVDKDATIIFGIVNSDTLKKDEMKIVVIATKFPSNYRMPLHRSSEPVYMNIDSEKLKLESVAEEKVEKNEEKKSEEKKVKFKEDKEEREDLNIKESISSFIKNKRPEPTISEAEEKIKSRLELNNELDEDNLLDIKRMRKVKEEKGGKGSIFLEEVEDEEEDDDWNMLPPFLRKKK
ncbi:Cell division protein FtsZ [bioreactor metagenome]|uniref:Cell division protein FtsZ n=1 Tax=bioreactor metagenome TaxID=1076179 RepID=A0A644T773_9ZZZZ|nr:cell division protein FtsZ [Candidatus Elulimicrobiales bacterium]